jgi:hypothetical protein
MESDTIIVELVVTTDPTELSLRENAWSLALDQQAFGPGRLLVATADRAGNLLAIAHTTTTDPPHFGLACCLEHTFRNGIVPEGAVVFNDEPVEWGPPPAELRFRFVTAREQCAQFGVHLVDWFCCDADSELIRSSRIAFDPDSEWWDVA